MRTKLIGKTMWFKKKGQRTENNVEKSSKGEEQGTAPAVPPPLPGASYLWVKHQEGS